MAYNAKIRASGKLESWGKCLVCANLNQSCLNMRDSCGSYKNDGNPVVENPSHILSRLRKKVEAQKPKLVVVPKKPAIIEPAPPAPPLMEDLRLDRLRAMRQRVFSFYCYVRDKEYCKTACERDCEGCPSKYGR